MTTERNIIIHAGQAFTLSLDYAGTAGRGQRMHIRASDSADDVIAILTHNGATNARVIYDGTDSLDITIGASVNGGWLVGANRVEWVYDIEDYDLSDTDDVVIAYRGKAIVYGNRTRPEDVTPSAALASGDGRYVRFDGVQGLSDAQKLQARENIGAGTGGGGSSDHGALTGLADDDHTQYALADGSRGTFATAAQGALADTAVQPAAIATKLDDLSAGTADAIVTASADGTLLGRAAYTITSLLAAAYTRASHTGTQLASTISDFASAALSAVTWSTLTGKPSTFDPSAHKTSHATGGGDALTPADIGAQPVATVLTNTTASFTTAQESKLAGIETSADVTDAGNVGAAIDGATAKTTPVDADTVPLIDSAASNVLKKLSWTNIKATLKTYFDTLYATASQGTDDRTASGLRSATTVVSVSAATAPTSGQVLTATGGSAATWQTPSSGGTPAGSSGQFQYNDASAFGGANLWRESTDIIALRNGTTAQAFRVFDTYTDGSNGAYLELNPGAAGDWMQLRAVTAGTGADNYSIALTPSGTGAISAHVPDSTAVGGNARGAYSLDLQRYRDSAGQVASGGNAVAFGISNTASGSTSVVSGGSTNFASGSFSAISGGRSNVASGSDSWVPGGYQGTTRGLAGTGAYSSGQRSAVGDAQVILQPVRRTTTDATPVSLATNGTPAATTVMVLPASSTLMVTAIVCARDSSGNSAGWIAQALFKRDGSNNTTRLGTATVTAIGTPDAAINTATIDLVANDTLEAAEIQVTGVAATTIYWVGELKCIQVA